VITADRRRRARAVLDAAGGVVLLVPTILAAPFLRRAYNRWGTTKGEGRCHLPGDALIPAPKLSHTRAITIEASPASGDQGRSTRLLSRQRLTFPGATSILWHLLEPIDFVMERRMLYGIKRRAERAESVTERADVVAGVQDPGTAAERGLHEAART
jgi:hypothetical protein